MTAQTILPANSVRGGDIVTNSLRFNDGDSPALTRSLGTTTLATKGTFSFWVKRGALTAAQMIYSNEVADDNNRGFIQFEDDDTIRIVDSVGGSNQVLYKTAQLFRDITAWYHIVVQFDTTAAGGARVKVFKNGTRIPDAQFGTSTEPNQNASLKILTGGQTNKNHIGKIHGGSNHFDGYLAEFVYCDGQVLDADSFGEFDSDSGVWKPIDVSGLTRGDQGFYLDFEDSSALGNDKGGSNNFGTVTNLAAIDQSIDTCINNYPTFNSLDNFYNDDTLSQANQTMTGNSQQAHRIGTIGLSAGKWYWEVRASTWQTANQSGVGIAAEGPTATDYEFYNQSGTIVGYAYYSNGAVYGNGSTIVSGGGYTFNNASSIIVGVALNLTDNKLAWSHNGTWQGSTDPGAGTTNMLAITAPSSTKNGVYFPACKQKTNNRVLDINFGSPGFSISSSNADANDHGNFEYEVPSGYFAINTKNLAEYG